MENYQFIKQIGHGSYGEVWLVKCSNTRKKHVLKRIDLQHTSKREQRAAHLEAKLLSTIKHPNIVTYLDSFYNSTGSLFIVMTYCECGDLYTSIKNQCGIHFEEKLIVHWFVQICLALKYLHDKNILHRNLKTRNIFLTKNQIVKVGDLGISKVLSTIQEMSAILIETPYYISPENISGKHLTQKSDIWALGCCTYEMAALRHPYVAQDSHSLLQKIRKGKLPAIPEIYSMELFELILSMLNQDPEKRPFVTHLLLNDYIRRYILLILQDSSKSPDSQISENVSEISSERSKSSSELSLQIPKDGSNCFLERSKSTFLLPNNTVKNPNISGASPKQKKRQAKSVIVSVPDVNGNGDGNDNSQHGAIRNISKSHYLSVNHLSRTGCLKEKELPEISNKVSDDGFRRNQMPKVNSSIHSTNSSASLKNSEASISASQQKMKGKVSFQILNNLAYSMYTSRQEKFIDTNFGNISFETRASNALQPKSLNDTNSGKKSEIDVKNIVKSTNGNSKTVFKGKLQSSSCVLPKIK